MCFARPLVLGVRWGMRRVVIGGASSLLQRGTNSATFSPPVAGDYTCTVTAANQAGSTSLTSAVKKVKVK
jgi:hypothetical protein